MPGFASVAKRIIIAESICNLSAEYRISTYASNFELLHAFKRVLTLL